MAPHGPRKIGTLHVQQLDEEVLIYNEDDGRAHALNQVAALVLDHCDGERDRHALVTAVAAVVETPVDLDVIDLALNDLVEANLITTPEDLPSVSRRSLIRKIGVGAAAAAALPIVESIVTPAAAVDLRSGNPPTPLPTPWITTAPPTVSPSPSPTPTVGTPPPTLSPQPTVMMTASPSPSPVPTGPPSPVPTAPI